MQAQATPIAQCIAGEDHRIIWCDDAYLELLGLERQEIVGRHPLELTHGTDRPLNAALLGRLTLEGAAFAITKRYKCGDHRLQWVTNNVSLLKDGLAGPSRVIATSMAVARPVTSAALLRNVTAARRLCAAFVTGKRLLGADLIAAPGTEILLLLYIAEIEGQCLTADTIACKIAQSSAATRRWLKVLQDRGLVMVEQGDPLAAETPFRITRRCELALDDLVVSAES